jgi:hypothetical protein
MRNPILFYPGYSKTRKTNVIPEICEANYSPYAKASEDLFPRPFEALAKEGRDPVSACPKRGESRYDISGWTYSETELLGKA